MIDGKKSQKKLLGQSGRHKVPIVSDIKKFQNIIENVEKYDIVLLPYENEVSVTLKEAISLFKENNKDKKTYNIAYVIGPEGGYSPYEIDALTHLKNTSVVTLGKRILRTETAAIAVASMLLYEFEL